MANLVHLDRIYQQEKEIGESLIRRINDSIDRLYRCNRREPNVVLIDYRSYQMIAMTISSTYYDNCFLTQGHDGFKKIFGVRLLICDQMVEGEILIY
jgi:hypothetical protein